MKKFWRSTAMTVLLFLLAVGLLSVGVVGGTQAALQIFSDEYFTSYDLDYIGVALFQDDSNHPVAERTYLDKVVNGDPKGNLDGELKLDLAGDKEILLGKQYSMPVAAKNTGTIDQYVRVIIHKYWVQNASGDTKIGNYFHNSGTKIVNDVYRPDYIQLGYNGGTNNYNTNNWILDGTSSTAEREIYYYREILHAGQTTAPLFTNISISSEITQDAVMTTVGNKTIYTYAYDGYGFVVQAEVDAVQTHNKEAAIKSSWGTPEGIVNNHLPKPDMTE